MESLQDLRLAGCRYISDDGVRDLVSGKPLTRLDLNGCDRITERIVPVLQKLPLVDLRLSLNGPYVADLEELGPTINITLI